MKIRVLGSGWYGCHIAVHLINKGYDVVVHELADKIFAGASGANPARLHLGFHYPRSKLTRAACQDHYLTFMKHYGDLTSVVPINIYAIAQDHSLVDFGTYKQVLQGEVDFIDIHNPGDYGLRNVEGALLTGERHVVIKRAREYFTEALKDHIVFFKRAGDVDDIKWDLTIDCTFCSFDGTNIDRYEPCIMGIMRGDCRQAVTIMDGPFTSIYPWDESRGFVSITSAKLTPLSKECKTYEEAQDILDNMMPSEAVAKIREMRYDIAEYWPDAKDFLIDNYMFSIRAMPLSGADARLVDIVEGERSLRVRAGKIDAIFHAAEEVERLIEQRK